VDINYYKQYEPIFGEWRITRQLGEGSFGKVFAMEREDFGVRYEAALKAITVPASKAELEEVMADGMDENAVRAYYQSFVQELVREFELMSHLKGNSNIVSYENHKVIPHEGSIGWDILIQMELLTPLNKYAKQHQITRQDVIKLGIDMCKALELCQKYNIIHRDVKPENIFISANGDFKLGDFGIARTIEKTTSGLSKKGTYTYMAPEVYKGQEYGSSVDIYSLGIVLYRLLNENRTPFLPAYPAPITHSDRENALAKRFSGVPLPPPVHAEGRLAEIVLKACAYDPKERYQVPLRMRQDLEAILYSREEARYIYPGGDEAPQPSVDYVKTGEEEKVPEYEKTAGPADNDRTVSDMGGIGADSQEEDGTVSDFGSPKRAGKNTGIGAGTVGAEAEDSEKTVSDFGPHPGTGAGAGSQGRGRGKGGRGGSGSKAGLIAGIIFLIAAAGGGIFYWQKTTREKAAAEAAAQAAAESEAARLAQEQAEAESRAAEEAWQAAKQNAIDLYLAGSYEEAAAAAKEVLALEPVKVPGDEELIGVLADSEYMMEDFESSASHYYELGQREGYQWKVESLRNYAVCLARIGEFDQAATIFVMLTNMGAEADVTSYVLGETYLAKGETDNAIDAFRKALDGTQNDMIRERSIRSLAEIYRDIKAYSESITLLTGRADLTNPVYTEMLGEAYYQKYQDTGDKEAAGLGAKAFEKTIRLGVQKEYLYTNTIWLYNLAGTPAAAADTLAEMERLYPNDHLPETLHSICLIYEENDKPAEERDYTEALRYHDLAAAKVTVNDDTTYLQMLESILDELRRNGWIS